jgi:hypothetical protein
MDIFKMIAELRAEKAAVEEALVVLERLAGTQRNGRGRPALFLTQRTGGLRKRKSFSEETKQRMAASQRKRWAAYRKEQKSA